MKKFYSILAVLVLLLFGCNSNNDSSSVAPKDVNTGNKEGAITNPNWITLPSRGNLSIEGDVSVTKQVRGNDETSLEINTGYAGGPHGWIQISANARIQRNSFTGVRSVTMSINDQFGMATFTPSVTFSKPVIYNLTIIGLDLSKVKVSKIKFGYQDADGNYYEAKYQSLYVEKQSGKLQVINAELPHFSRYGFWD